MEANQTHLLIAGLVSTLIQVIRSIALVGIRLAKRLKLLTLGAVA